MMTKAKEKQRPKCVVRYTCDNSCEHGWFGGVPCSANKSENPEKRCELRQEDSFTDAEKIAALRAALEELGGGWQPIETAPKDGTPILVCLADNNITTAEYLGEWCLISFAEGHIDDSSCTPTYWMPLPKPPKE